MCVAALGVALDDGFSIRSGIEDMSERLKLCPHFLPPIPELTVVDNPVVAVLHRLVRSITGVLDGQSVVTEDDAVLVLADNGFAIWDWLVVGVYLALVIAIGMLVGRKRSEGDDYFLAGRSMPMWAVAISVLATSQSAATFVGGPQQAYAGNLTYFMANLGGLLAVIIVAVLFIPAFYRYQVTSIYEILGHRCGPADHY